MCDRNPRQGSKKHGAEILLWLLSATQRESTEVTGLCMGSGKFPDLAGTRVIVARSEQMGGCGQSTGIYTPDSSASGLT